MRERPDRTTTYSVAGAESHNISASTLRSENGNTHPDARRDNRASSLVNYPGATASGAFCFVGTASEHLARVEREIDRQRKAHRPVSDLLKRQRILKARCAALGAQHG